MQIGCKKVLSICYQNDLNMYEVNAAEESAAFVVYLCLYEKNIDKSVSLHDRGYGIINKSKKSRVVALNMHYNVDEDMEGRGS